MQCGPIAVHTWQTSHHPKGVVFRADYVTGLQPETLNIPSSVLLCAVHKAGAVGLCSAQVAALQFWVLL